MMRSTFTAVLIFLALQSVHADDDDAVSAKMHEYFELFNAREVTRVAEYIYGAPVHIGSESGNRVLSSSADAITNLRNLYDQIDKQRWRRSVISEIHVCILSDGLAFADTYYARVDEDGNAIPPEIRSNVYVLRMDAGEWRIIAFYSHDPERPLDCA